MQICLRISRVAALRGRRRARSLVVFALPGEVLRGVPDARTGGN